VDQAQAELLEGLVPFPVPVRVRDQVQSSHRILVCGFIMVVPDTDCLIIQPADRRDRQRNFGGIVISMDINMNHFSNQMYN
jgi:hypothetical protein